MTRESAVGVAAEYHVKMLKRTHRSRSKLHPLRVPHPGLACTLQKAANNLALGINALDKEIHTCCEGAQKRVPHEILVELMPVSRKTPFPAPIECMLLINLDSDEAGEDIRGAIMVPRDPNDLLGALGVGELAEIGKERPIIVVEAAEIQVIENIAVQDKLFERERLQLMEQLLRAAGAGAQVNIGYDNDIKFVHIICLNFYAYSRLINYKSILT